MRRLSVTFLLFLLLAGCGGSAATSAIVCKQQYWDGTVGICLPDGWKVVDKETLAQRGAPPEVTTAFQTDSPVSGQFPTITVTKETLAQAVDTPTYSQASIRSVTALPGYKLVDSQNVTIDGQAIQLHIFTAQPIAEEPARRFYQISSVSNGIGYTYTALTPLSVSDMLDKQILLMMKSMTLKDPGAGSSSK